MPTDLEHARGRWLRERPKFQEFVELIVLECRKTASELAVWADISGRAKDVDSLVKKLIKKPEHSYESLTDKAGVRVIVRYKSEIQPIVEALQTKLDCVRIENKVDSLPVEKFGYLSVHVDARLQIAHPASIGFPPEQFQAEVQVRTMAQHLWSEMSHDAFYKGDLAKIPKPVQRRLYALAGVVELADDEFTRVASDVPSSPEVEILRSLERHFYRFAAQRGDPDLSVDVIQALLPIYGQEPVVVARHLDEFLNLNADFLRELYAVQRDSDNRSAYFFQPEALLVYDLLQEHRWEVRRVWDEHFPPGELDRLSTAFGIVLD